MSMRSFLFGASIFGVLGFSLVLSAQTTAPAAATKPASAPATAASAPATKAASAPATAAAAGPTAQTKTCLRCHPFDKLREDTKDWVAPTKDKMTPHYYIPHDQKTDANVPECTKCHKVHALDPLPEKGQIDLSKLNVDWCFEACHHEKNFEKCNKCH